VSVKKMLLAVVAALLLLVGAGVATERILPVVNVAPRQPRARAEAAATLADLGRLAVGTDLVPPVFLPRRRVGEALRDGARVPSPLPQLLAGAWEALLARSGTADRAGAAIERLQPGTLGAWSTGHEEVAGA
jgi:hypothetical protein